MSAAVSWLSSDMYDQHVCVFVWTFMPEVLHLVTMSATQCCIQRPHHMLCCFVVWTFMPEVVHLVTMGATQCCIQQPCHMLCRNMHEATTSLPIIGDGDTGYGNAINVKRTVRGYAAAGFAGILIEDQVRRGR